jgi:hypothetical protein
MPELSADKQPGRNDPCPCGSGLKYKKCCMRRRASRQFADHLPLFTVLPPEITTYYLDTCVWSEVFRSRETCRRLIESFRSRRCIAGISLYGLLELSRAPALVESGNYVFREMCSETAIPYLFDDLVEEEMRAFPRRCEMHWLSLNRLIDEKNPSFLETIANDQRMLDVRDQHRQFGRDYFMNLEDMKGNFPPLHGDDYTVEDAPHFAFGVLVEYLGRHFPAFLKSVWPAARRFVKRNEKPFDFGRLQSVYIRTLLIFFKYYLHGQSPQESDFFDFAHVAYAPYCDVFVTERNVCNVLNHIKSSGLMLADVEIVHITDFASAVASGGLKKPDEW